MSKHDNYSKIEEIKNYYRNEDFLAAAELADSVDWQSVKSWDALAMMADTYENLGELENARDMAILAYNRNLGGNKLVYKLTDLLIKTGDLDDAEDVFNEYCQISKNAPDSYILEYHLLREKNAPDKELIRVLEEFKEIEPNERYMYRLAELYAKNGENEKCAEVCDNIALWFKDGDFAEGAVKLKKKTGAGLSPEQEKLFSSAKVKEEDLSKTGEVDLKGQINLGAEPEEEASSIEKGAAAAAAAGAAAAGGAVAAGAAGKIRNLVKNVFNDEEFDEEGSGMTAKVPASDIKAAAGEGSGETGDIAASEQDADTAAGAAVVAGSSEVMQDKDRHDIDPEIKENLSAEVKEELENESALRGEGVYAGEKQIDGQVNMTDWMTDVREKKYGGQSTKEYSKTELERMLEEKEEKSEAYDRLMAEQRKLADESGKPFNEANAKHNVEIQLAIDAARRDLDIRTGKGTAKMESAAEAVSIPASSEPEERPREETVLGAVLEAAGTEAVRESAGRTSDPSERMLRIESAVLSLLGARLSDKISVRGTEAPEDVVNAAALLVRYISGEYDSLQAAGTKTDPVADTKEEEKKSDVSGKEDKPDEAEAEIVSDASEEKNSGIKDKKDIADKKDDKKTEEQEKSETSVKKDTAKKVSAEVLKDSKDLKEKKSKKPVDKTSGKTGAAGAAVAGAAVAGAAAVTGGVLHEKARKAKEIFEGSKTEDTVMAAEIKGSGKKPSEMKPHEAEALKEIQGSKAPKEPVLTYDEEIMADRNAGREAGSESGIKDIPDEKAKKSRERNTGKTPDLGKMKLKKVTAEHVEAHLTDDEIAVAQGITSADKAADIITKRITAPISTADVEKAVAASENGDININEDDTFTDTTHIDKKMLREIIESSDGDDESEGKSTRRFDTTSKQDTSQLDNVLREDLPKGKREKIKGMFDEYYDMPEIDAQIEEYIAALPVEITREDSRNGNIIIAGADSVDKTALAKTIAKAVNISYPKKKKKIIRTTGENLNQYGFARSAEKLRGSFLVIEKAGIIKPEVISEIVDVMRKDTGRMIVIAEDTDSGIESFMNSNPALPKLFNHRINMRPFTTDELVEIAKDLAGQKGFQINDEGTLALYLEIDELRASEPKITIDDMDALTDDAIAHARKRIKRETGISPKRQDESVSVLTNDDFRY